MGRSTMPGDRHKYRAVLIAWTMALAVPLVGGPATAQISSYISNNPSVIVDTDVLESLGGRPLVVDGIVAASPRQKVDVQRTTPARLPAPATQPALARLPSPAVAPRSRLNSDAMARLGFRQIPPPPKKPATVKQAAPATKARTAAVPPAPAAAPKPVPVQPAATTPSPVRQAAKVPTRPVLPAVKAPDVTRQTTRQASVAPPPPPAPPAATAAPATSSQTTVAKAVPQPAVAAALVPTKQAAVERGDDDGLRLLFEGGSAKLSDGARTDLQSLTAKLGADEALQVQLVAYAAGTAETSSQARRLSLSRALAVRSFLIDKGVRSTRMDIRALGNKAKDGPADRVDVVLVQK
ncbi:MAG: OmpA family protein [Alphaproteobacteria bacterium]